MPARADKRYPRIPLPVEDQKTGCLIWMGRIDKNGYGRWGAAWAHREMYRREVGEIPSGFEVDHTCSNPPCVEPSHLEAVPPKVNRGRVDQPRVCKRGHPLEGANLVFVVTRPGARICRACKRMRDAAFRRAHGGPINERRRNKATKE